MTDKEKYLIIGFFGYDTDQIDGQTVRSRNIRRILSDVLKYPVTFYDTQSFRKKPFSIFKLLYFIPAHKYIVILPAHRNVKFLMPIITIYSKLFFKKIFFIAIGGWLPVFVKKLSYLRFFLKRMEQIFVQTADMKLKLEDDGLTNISLLPNFKFHDFQCDSSEQPEEGGLKVIFMSRVMKEKGLDTIENLAKKIEANNLPINIDLYGPMIEVDKPYVNNITAVHNSVNYCGLVQPHLVHEVMSKYDVFLFPTHFMTEGFPGVVLDAFIAGIPVVASKWDYATEFIDDEVGFLYEHDKWEQAYKLLTLLLNNKPLLVQLKRASYKRREKYSVPSIIEILKKAKMVKLA